MSAIFITTWKEAARKKTFLVMGAVTLLYLIFWAVLLHFYIKTAQDCNMTDAFMGVASHIITQMGLQFSSMLMALLTVMLGAGGDFKRSRVRRHTFYSDAADSPVRVCSMKIFRARGAGLRLHDAALRAYARVGAAFGISTVTDYCRKRTSGRALEY